jgi:hypothetical protein
MSSLSSLLGGGVRIVTAMVGTPFVQTNVNTLAQAAGATTAASGTVSAGVLKTALSVTGKGCLNWGAIYSATVTSKTLRVQITIDGTVVRNFTSSPVNAANTGYVFCGTGFYATGSSPVAFQPLFFKTSLLVEFADSTAETNGLTFASNHEVHA